MNSLKVILYGPWTVLCLALFCSPSFPLIFIYFFISLIISYAFVNYSYEIISSKEENKSSINSLIKYNKWNIILSFIVLLSFGYRADYPFYIDQWETILKGLDPWIGTNNAYGPIHNLLALFYYLHPFLPKLIFFLSFYFAIFMNSFGHLPYEKDLNKKDKLKSFLLFGFCPFAVLGVVVFSYNDSLVASLISLSIFYAISKNDKKGSRVSGILMGFATMLKFYPLIIASVFLIKKRRIDFVFGKFYLITLSLITTVSYYLWGSSVLNPIFFASSRHSKHFSFFNTIRNRLSINLDHLSVFLMIIAFLVVFFVIQKYKFDLIPSVIIIFASVLSVYKVGHQQFFVFFFSITPLLIRYFFYNGLQFNSKLIHSYFLWLGYLNFYQIMYHLTCGLFDDLGLYLRHFGSIPYMILNLYLCYQLYCIMNNNLYLISNNESI